MGDASLEFSCIECVIKKQEYDARLGVLERRFQLYKEKLVLTNDVILKWKAQAREKEDLQRNLKKCQAIVKEYRSKLTDALLRLSPTEQELEILKKEVLALKKKLEEEVDGKDAGLKLNEQLTIYAKQVDEENQSLKEKITSLTREQKQVQKIADTKKSKYTQTLPSLIEVQLNNAPDTFEDTTKVQTSEPLMKSPKKTKKPSLKDVQLNLVSVCDVNVKSSSVQEESETQSKKKIESGRKKKNSRSRTSVQELDNLVTNITNPKRNSFSHSVDVFSPQSCDSGVDVSEGRSDSQIEPLRKSLPSLESLFDPDSPVTFNHSESIFQTSDSKSDDKNSAEDKILPCLEEPTRNHYEEIEEDSSNLKSVEDNILPCLEESTRNHCEEVGKERLPDLFKTEEEVEALNFLSCSSVSRKDPETRPQSPKSMNLGKEIEEFLYSIRNHPSLLSPMSPVCEELGNISPVKNEVIELKDSSTQTINIQLRAVGTLTEKHKLISCQVQTENTSEFIEESNSGSGNKCVNADRGTKSLEGSQLIKMSEQKSARILIDDDDGGDKKLEESNLRSRLTKLENLVRLLCSNKNSNTSEICSSNKEPSGESKAIPYEIEYTSSCEKQNTQVGSSSVSSVVADHPYCRTDRAEVRSEQLPTTEVPLEKQPYDAKNKLKWEKYVPPEFRQDRNPFYNKQQSNVTRVNSDSHKDLGKMDSSVHGEHINIPKFDYCKNSDEVPSNLPNIPDCLPSQEQYMHMNNMLFQLAFQAVNRSCTHMYCCQNANVGRYVTNSPCFSHSNVTGNSKTNCCQNSCRSNKDAHDNKESTLKCKRKWKRIIDTDTDDSCNDSTYSRDKHHKKKSVYEKNNIISSTDSDSEVDNCHYLPSRRRKTFNKNKSSFKKLRKEFENKKLKMSYLTKPDDLQNRDSHSKERYDLSSDVKSEMSENESFKDNDSSKNNKSGQNSSPKHKVNLKSHENDRKVEVSSSKLKANSLTSHKLVRKKSKKMSLGQCESNTKHSSVQFNVKDSCVTSYPTCKELFGSEVDFSSDDELRNLKKIKLSKNLCSEQNVTKLPPKGENVAMIYEKEIPEVEGFSKITTDSLSSSVEMNRQCKIDEIEHPDKFPSLRQRTDFKSFHSVSVPTTKLSKLQRYRRILMKAKMSSKIPTCKTEKLQKRKRNKQPGVAKRIEKCSPVKERFQEAVRKIETNFATTKAMPEDTAQIERRSLPDSQLIQENVEVNKSAPSVGVIKSNYMGIRTYKRPEKRNVPAAGVKEKDKVKIPPLHLTVVTNFPSSTDRIDKTVGQNISDISNFTSCSESKNTIDLQIPLPLINVENLPFENSVDKTAMQDVCDIFDSTSHTQSEITVDSRIPLHLTNEGSFSSSIGNTVDKKAAQNFRDISGFTSQTRINTTVFSQMPLHATNFPSSFEKTIETTTEQNSSNISDSPSHGQNNSEISVKSNVSCESQEMDHCCSEINGEIKSLPQPLPLQDVSENNISSPLYVNPPLVQEIATRGYRYRSYPIDGKTKVRAGDVLRKLICTPKPQRKTPNRRSGVLGKHKVKELKTKIGEAMKRLMSNYSDIETFKTIVKELGEINTENAVQILSKHMLKFIRKKEFYGEDVCAVNAVPLLSEPHKCILTLLYKLHSQYEQYTKLPHTVLLGIEYCVFRLGYSPDTSKLSSLGRFYAALCRLLHDKKRLQAFCYDALYCLTYKAYCLLYAVITTCPDTIPHAEEGKENLLVTCIISVLLSQRVDGRGQGSRTANWNAYRTNDLLHLLKRKYGYKTDITLSKIFDVLVDKLKSSDGKVEYLEASFILVAKRMNYEAIYKKLITNIFYPLLSEWKNGSVSDNVIEQVIMILGYVTRCFPVVEAKVQIQDVLNHLRSILVEERNVPIKIQEAAVLSLLRLSRSSFIFVASVLLNWRPSADVSDELTKEIKSFLSIRNQRWWRGFLGNGHCSNSFLS